MHEDTRLARTQSGRDRVRAERRREGQVAAGEGLADAHDVWSDTGVVGGEELAGPAETGRDLVEDQHQVVGVGNLAEHVQTLWWVDVHPPGALEDRLADDRGQLVAVAIGQLPHAARPVVDGGVEAAGGPRRKNLPRQHPLEHGVHSPDRIAHAHRAGGVSVVAPAQREHPGLAGAAPGPAGTAPPS